MIETRPHLNRMPAADRRQQLLETALDLFSQKGFGGTTTKEIAAAAGVTEAIIFRHFPNKQALYTAVLDYKLSTSELQDWLAETKACMDRNDDAGLLRAIARNTLRGYRADPRMERILLFAALEGHELGLGHHRRLAIPIFEVLRSYVVRRQRAGALRGFNPGAIIEAIAGVAQHYAMMTGMFGYKPPDDLSDEEAIETFTKIVMNGIQPAKKPKSKA
ncbi:MAG TPA: TetR/AcrR family transcriptional regulator [Bryobacteraceae bacterium]|nr:TetR/AcrR family transcriptional regulator [Bryobacteraceae bacterium]